MKNALAVILILLAVSLNAQKAIYLKVVDSAGSAVEGAYLKLNKQAAATNKNGIGVLFPGVDEGRVNISHLSYNPGSLAFRFGSSDTLFLKYVLSVKAYQLRPALAIDKRVPEPVFNSFFHYVHDFELMDDRLVMITFNRSLKKDPALTLSSLEEKVIDEKSLPSKPVGLFKDFAGRLFVEFEGYAKLIELEGDSIQLRKIDLREYYHSVKPCMDSTNKQILFSDQIWYLPRFNYYSFDIQDSMMFLLRNVVHKQVNHMMRWEYYDMRIDDQRKARKIAEHFPDLDPQEVAGLMSGFQNTIFYEVPYAPLFIKNDTILIFDHYANYLYRYSDKLETIDSVRIDYHKPRKRWTWKDKIYHDESANRFYALYIQNGYAYLKVIDESTGSVNQVSKLQNQFVKKIKVLNGYAYYIHKPASSPDKPTIYRELLTME